MGGETADVQNVKEGERVVGLDIALFREWSGNIWACDSNWVRGEDISDCLCLIMLPSVLTWVKLIHPVSIYVKLQDKNEVCYWYNLADFICES